MTQWREVLKIARTKLQHTARTVRLTGYSFCIGAGWLLATIGPPFVGLYWQMGITLLIGSTLSLIGTLDGRWAWELLGLPLLSATLVALALLTGRDAHTAPNWIWVPSVLILGAFGVLMLARWFDLFILAKASAWLHRVHQEAESHR